MSTRFKKLVIFNKAKSVPKCGSKWKDKITGYIYSPTLTTKLWKNSIGFEAAVNALPQRYDDWECYNQEDKKSSYAETQERDKVTANIPF